MAFLTFGHAKQTREREERTTADKTNNKREFKQQSKSTLKFVSEQFFLDGGGLGFDRFSAFQSLSEH